MSAGATLTDVRICRDDGRFYRCARAIGPISSRRARVAAGLSKSAAAREFGISRQSAYRYLQPATDAEAQAELDAVLARLPTDTRPLPTTDAYDELIPPRSAT